MKCRHCHTQLTLPMVDLGSAPPSNAYLTTKTLKQPEKWFPLRVLVCNNCWLVQTEDFAAFNEMFDSEYAYFSSFSTSWLKHAELYTKRMIERFDLGKGSHVVEVAANDGYLLQYFDSACVPCLGVEPTANTAAAAREKGIEIVEEFFGEAIGHRLAKTGKSADLTAANNVLAHVPDINDFVRGFTAILKPDGVSTFEFPWLLNLVEQNQFDTIYHEHFSYLSLSAVRRIFEANGLQVFDVEELPTHGGSLRVFAQRLDTKTHIANEAVAQILAKEDAAGLNSTDAYFDTQRKADAAKDGLVRFLLDARADGKTVAGYGAAAKGNTLLNYAGVRPDLMPFVVDRNPAKSGKFMPGSRIPIVTEETLKETKPDYIIILPWNLREEVSAQLSYARDWGAKFVTAIPALVVSQ
ncbi:MAG: class I SAM-dependent methyltransferase [Tateyamaria sp.]|uniref:methyltransferase domain-containing protein n=1 Tax=Tateyamaria sp. TaxID=1929288 RepID=UPI0032A0C22B